MKAKFIKTLFVFVIVCLCTNIDAQTVIREKVKIKPAEKKINFLSQKSTNSGAVSFSVSWTDSFDTAFLFDDDINNNTGWLHGISSYNGSLKPHATGEYSLQIRKTGSSVVDYTFYCGEAILAQGTERIFKDSECCPAYGGISCSYIEGNDFVFWFTKGSLCNSRTSTTLYPSMEYNYDPAINAAINSGTETNITLTKNNADVELFNSSGQSLGQSTKVSFKDIGQIGIRLLSPYFGQEEDTVNVTIVANGISRDSQLFVEGKGTFYLGCSILDNYEFLHGAYARIDLTASSSSYCSKEYLPQSTKYNVEIVKGIQYGRIAAGNTNLLGTSFYNLNHENGETRIEYFADGIIPAKTDTIIIKISTTDPKILPIDIPLIIHPQKIRVTFEPATLAVGDTAGIILKKINDNGTIEDFSPDQWFEYQLIEGMDYGTFYIADWGSTTNSFTGLPQQIKFVATSGKVDTTVYSKILVKTTAGWATKVVPGKSSTPVAGNFLKGSARIMKTTSTQDDNEQLWGEGVVSIGNTRADTFYVKARFDKPNFSAGDLLNVSFVKVDKNGNESSFPQGTLFEARVDEGCAVGKIIGGTNDSYGQNMHMPIQFQVYSSLTEADTLIVLKVGVPGNDGNTYLSYKTLSNKNETTALNLKINSKLMKVTGSTSACGGDGFNNTINANAVATSGGDCEKPENQCTTNEPQGAPIFSFVHKESDNEECNKPNKIAGLLFYEKPIQPFNSVVCYNKALAKWIVKINEDNRITINYSSYWCDGNMRDKWLNLIGSFSGVESIDKDEICIAIGDLIKQRNLNSQGTSYAISEVIGEHENQHLLVYKSQADKIIMDLNFSQKFIQFSKSCKEIKNKEIYISDIEKEANVLLAELQKRLDKKVKETKGTEDDGYGNPDAQYRENEENAQFAAFTKVGKKYLTRLAERGIALGQEECVKWYKAKYFGLFK